VTREKEIKKEKFVSDQSGTKILMLINDDFHTFDYVISALMEVCGHTPEQAEQCAFITHFKGKCDVARGAYEDLSGARKALTDRELKAEIV